MASNQLANLWNEKQNYFKTIIEGYQKEESALVAALDTLKPDAVAYKKIELAEICLDVFSYQIILNDLSKELIKIKSETYLGDARKTLYKAVSYLEEVVTPYVDVPFSDYEDNLKLIAGFGERDRLQLTNKLAFAIQLLISGYGENSKWKWSYVELKARYAAILKNFIDLKKYVSDDDPRSPGYQERFILVSKVKQSFLQVANAFREKYELTSQHLDDMQSAIGYLSALKRLHTIFGESEDADDIRKKIDVWKAKMENDSRKQEKSDLINQQAKRDESRKKKGLFGF